MCCHVSINYIPHSVTHQLASPNKQNKVLFRGGRACMLHFPTNIDILVHKQGTKCGFSHNNVQWSLLDFEIFKHREKSQVLFIGCYPAQSASLPSECELSHLMKLHTVSYGRAFVTVLPKECLVLIKQSPLAVSALIRISWGRWWVKFIFLFAKLMQVPRRAAHLSCPQELVLFHLGWLALRSAAAPVGEAAWLSSQQVKRWDFGIKANKVADKAAHSTALLVKSCLRCIHTSCTGKS